MGGQVSEVSPDTRRVLIESAYFNPPHIRRASKRLGLSTESSYRFERGVDPDGVILALDRAAQLMAALGGGQVLPGRIDVYPTPVPRPRLSLRGSPANRDIGMNYTLDQVEARCGTCICPPSTSTRTPWRCRCRPTGGTSRREIDLIEEVARLGGYGEIPVTLPHGVVATPRPTLAAAPQKRGQGASPWARDSSRW